MDPALVEDLLRQATTVRPERGACLMTQGGPADAGYVVTSGRLSVVIEATGESLRGTDLLPGASVGEIGLITGGVRSATLRAERDSSLMRIAQADFAHMATAQPLFARRLMATVVQRLFEQIAPRRAAGAQVLVLLRAAAPKPRPRAATPLGTPCRCHRAGGDVRPCFDVIRRCIHHRPRARAHRPATGGLAEPMPSAAAER